MKVNIKKVRPEAMLPTRGTQGSAGSDLHACLQESLTLRPGERVVIPTGLAIEVPTGYGAFLFARSGLGIKHGVVPSNCVGVIDADYRGEMMVGLVNQGNEAYTIEPQERIAQMVILPVEICEFCEVEELSATQREEGGFGSTGRK